MRFEVVQRFALPVDAVAAAYLRPELYETFVDLPKLGEVRPIGVEDRPDGMRVRVWYRFTAPLPPGAGRVVRPELLTWREVTDYEPGGRRGSFRIEPEHYPDVLACAGGIEVVAGDRPGGCVRRVRGDLRIRLPFVLRAATGPVERVVVGGLQEALAAQVPHVEAFAG